MRYRTLIFVIVLSAIAFSACSDSSDRSSDGVGSSSPITPSTPTSTPDTAPSPTPTSGTGCENERQAVKTHLRRGRLEGDLDGDGSDEIVRLAVDRDARQGCRAFVVASSSSLEDIASMDDPNMSFDLGLPALDSLKPIGFGPGDELILVLSAGASTQFFGIASVIDGELVRVTVEDGPYEDVFPYGGSVGHLEASDCAEPDGAAETPMIVISGASSEGEDYRLTRRFFVSSEGAELVPEPELTERNVVTFDELVSYPEFGEAPFAHCD